MNETLGHTAVDIHNKRKLEGSPSEPERNKRPRFGWYVRLESESSVASEEDTESIHSIQEKETDVAQDTPDTDTKSEAGSSIGSGFEVELEFDVASLSESELIPLENCSSSDSEVSPYLKNSQKNSQIITEDTVAAVLGDTSLDRWASDGEDSDTSDFEEFGHTDFWSCAQCKSKNNNPLYRLCGKCFQEKKTFYPPRPKRQKKKRSTVSKRVSVAKLQSCLSGLSQDSGVGSSQELGIDFQQIQVPPQRNLKRRNSVATTSSQGPSSQDTIGEYSGINAQNASGDDGKYSQTTLDMSSDAEDLQPPMKKLRTCETAHVKDFSIEDFKIHSTKETKRCDIQDVLSQEFNINASNEMMGIRIESEDLKDFMKSPSDTVLSESKKLCIVCSIKERDCAFLHGKNGHVGCCYQCAMRTWRTRKRCPLCNRKVHNVVKLYNL